MNKLVILLNKGGQVLVIDKEKIYNYKIKNEEEYREYLFWQIKKETCDIMNRFGL